MLGSYRYCIKFAGIKIQFVLPSDATLPDYYKAFECRDEKNVDVEYKIELIDTPLEINRPPIAEYAGKKVYPYMEGRLSVYLSLTAEDRCQVALYMDKNRRNILYYPASMWDAYKKEIHFLHLLEIESVLLEKDAFLLHSSFVRLEGQAILFSGPSGIGKSTQASLWKNVLDAEILNGDRCVIRRMEDRFWGCGSPWCGTSQICRNEMFPIKGIFIIRQGEENQIKKMRAKAFLKLFEQIIVHIWDMDFVSKVTELISGLLETVPIYELTCRPDKEAVILAHKTLFEGDGKDES